MADSAAQLPAVRVRESVPAQEPDAAEVTVWRPYHAGCVQHAS